MLSDRATIEDKQRIAFDLLDARGAGIIDEGGLFSLLRLTCGRLRSDNAIQELVSALMARYPDGLSREDFLEQFSLADLAKISLNL